MARYVIANTGRVVLVLVNFQNKMLQYKLLDYILVSIPRVVIWNVTTKQVTLISSNPQMSRGRVPWSCLGLAVTSKIEWIDMIHTKRDW